MSYEISKQGAPQEPYSISQQGAVQEPYLRKWLMAQRQVQGTYPDGRIDWHGARVPRPITMSTIVWEDKILIAQRSDKVGDAKNKYSLINGYIDKVRPPARQAKREVGKETGIRVTENQIQVAPSYVLRNREEKRRYLIFPCLVMLGETAVMNAATGEPLVTLNWEHNLGTDTWVHPSEVKNFFILADLPEHINRALELEFGPDFRA